MTENTVESQPITERGEEEMKKEESNVFVEVCPRCGKIFRSLYEKQIEQQFKVHLISCPIKLQNAKA